MNLALLQKPAVAAAITPRWYQQAAVDAVFATWATEPQGRVIVVAPTGSGKTIMISMIIDRYLAEHPGQRVLNLTHRQELVVQNYNTFRKVSPHVHAGMFAASLGRKDRNAQVTFAMVQSVAKAVQLFRTVGLVIIDECHLIPHEGDGQYLTVLKALKEARGGILRVCGLTATPWRLNSGNLLEPYKNAEPLFDSIAYEIEMLDLIEEGHLCKIVPRGTKTKLDPSGVHKRGGEYIDSELDKKLNIEELNTLIAEEIIAAGQKDGRKAWLVFAITIDHATRLCNLIRERGVSADVVSSLTPQAERRQIVSDFRAGRITCLTNVDILSTGFDYTGIDLLALCRPTGSPGLLLQQAGRGLRTSEGKTDCALLDFAGNIARHGLLTNIQGVHKKARADETEEQQGPPVKECPDCQALVATGTRVCGECGYEFPAPPSREEKLARYSLADRVMDDAGAWLTVEDATYRHTPGNAEKPSVLVLSYRVTMSGSQVQATEIFCFNHAPHTYARQKAIANWRQRTGLASPSTVLEGVQRIAELKRPAQVRVVQNGKYYNVRGVKF